MIEIILLITAICVMAAVIPAMPEASKNFLAVCLGLSMFFLALVVAAYAFGALLFWGIVAGLLIL